MKIICSICGTPKGAEKCQIVQLTTKEKKSFEEKGISVNDKYFYCKPCWKVMTSEQAATMMANLYERQLLQAGVSKTQAAKQAQSYRTRLLEIAEKNDRDQS